MGAGPKWPPWGPKMANKVWKDVELFKSDIRCIKFLNDKTSEVLRTLGFFGVIENSMSSVIP